MKSWPLLIIFLLSSCNSLEGELYNFKKVSLLNSNKELVELEKGTTPAVLELKSNRLFTFKTMGQVFKFNIPKGHSIPEGDGVIYLESWEVGQTVGIYARVRSDIFYGELVRDRENCSWTERYDLCDDNGNCRVSYRRRNGSREVTFRNDRHEKKVSLNLVADSSGEVLSQFLGEKLLVKKVYIYESSCI